MSTSCCKVALGVGAQASGCDLNVLAGMRDLRIALSCYVLSYSETAAPDPVIDDIVMNTLINDPVNGDDEFLFYLITTKEKTLSHTFDWSCSEETDRKVYEETISGQVPLRNARTFYVLKQWMCQDVICLGKEAGDDGQWIIVGLGGGLKLTNVVGGTGEATSDNNNTTLTITGNELVRGFSYVDAGTPASTETLIDSITSTVV